MLQFRGWWCVLCALCLVPALLMGQATSSVTGIVTDVSGGVMPAVTVRLLDTKTGTETTQRTNDKGLYLFTGVNPGSGFQLSFSKEGFATLTTPLLAVPVGITTTQNVRMDVGGVTASVSVEDSATRLNLIDASVGNVITSEQVQSLPALLRETPIALMGLQAGVSFNPLGSTSNNTNGAVTGARTDQNNVTLDGIDVNDQAGGFAFAIIGNAPVESVQEFRSVTAVPDSLLGRSSGAEVILVTKSGTNTFHGSLYEYNRTAATAANDFFNNKSHVPTPALTRNQYGGSLGGPIRKDKLFFFFNYEGRKDRRASAQSRTVPLDNFRNGSLGYILNGNDAAGKPCTSSARANDPITGACIAYAAPAQLAAMDPAKIGINTALLTALNAQYPHANDLTGGDGINTGLFRFNAPVTIDDGNYVGRMDYHATDRQTLFGRVNAAPGKSTQTVQQFPTQPTAQYFARGDYTFSIGHNWVIDPTMVNQLTIGLSRQDNQFLTTYRPSAPNSISFSGTLFTSPLPSLSSQTRVVPTWTYKDTLSKTIGRHSLDMGGVVRPITSRTSNTNAFNFLSIGAGATLSLGAATVNGQPNPLRPANILNVTGSQNEWDSVFAAVLGRFATQSANFNYDQTAVNALPLGSSALRSFRTNEMEFYFQDTFRMRRDLTLLYGVRWSYYASPYETHGFESVPSLGLSQLFAMRQATASAGIGGNTAVPNTSYDLGGKINHGADFFKPTYKNFGPRVSLAWSPSYNAGPLKYLFGENKSSVRLGASIVNDRISAFTFIADQSGYLFSDSSGTAFGQADPTAALQKDPRFQSLTSSPVALTAPVHSRPVVPYVTNGVPQGEGQDQFNYAVDPNFKTPYEYVFNFGIQRQLPWNLTLEADYVGRSAHRLFTEADAAQIVNFRDPASGQYLISAFAPIETAVQNNTVSSLPNQPWFENQMNLAIAQIQGAGKTCQSLFGRSCTQQVAVGTTANSVRIGSLSNVVRTLNTNNLLLPNVGLYGQFSADDYVSSLGASNYNGLLVIVRKRLSQGLNLDFNYTLSHAIDNQSSVVNTVSGGTLCDLSNLRVCRGNSDYDVRHQITSDWVYQLPFGRNQYIASKIPAWANQIIGGWSVSGITSWRTGLPISFSPGDTPISRTVSGHGVFTGDMSLLKQSLHNTGTGSSQVLQFFADPTATAAAITSPMGGFDGNRNILRAPGFWVVDAAVLKNFKLPWHETHNVQFRAEAFNLFNHENFGNPNNSF
ncbi:MAG TPA: carboxypeptidase-like regulatory domain-containing protein, partial [Terriglobia bacterium]|nr:carboxypeptidase-like regulatory domain-containing protein [Terriglobia bacterium]